MSKLSQSWLFHSSSYLQPNQSCCILSHKNKSHFFHFPSLTNFIHPFQLEIFYSVLCYSFPFCSVLRCSALLYSIPLHSIPGCHALAVQHHYSDPTVRSHTSGSDISRSANFPLHLRSQWKKETMVICSIARNLTSEISFPNSTPLLWGLSLLCHLRPRLSCVYMEVYSHELLTP